MSNFLHPITLDGQTLHFLKTKLAVSDIALAKIVKPTKWLPGRIDLKTNYGGDFKIHFAAGIR